MEKQRTWLPGSRVNRLAMAQVWVRVLTGQAVEWDIDVASVVTPFAALVTQAAAALLTVSDETTRTHGDIVHCGEVFKALVLKMSFIKNNYFNNPPRTVEELESLELKSRKTPERIAVPEHEVSLRAHNLGDHLLEVILAVISAPGQDHPASDHGFRLYAAIVDSAAAPGTEGRYGKYLPAPPLSGKDFSWSVFTGQRRVSFDFDEQDRGKRVWFIAHLENRKGDKGPWGPLFWTIIP